MIVLSLKGFGLVFQDRDLVKTLRHCSVKKISKRFSTDRWGKLIGEVNTIIKGENDQASHLPLSGRKIKQRQLFWINSSQLWQDYRQPPYFSKEADSHLL